MERKEITRMSFKDNLISHRVINSCLEVCFEKKKLMLINQFFLFQDGTFFFLENRGLFVVCSIKQQRD